VLKLKTIKQIENGAKGETEHCLQAGGLLQGLITAGFYQKEIAETFDDLFRELAHGLGEELSKTAVIGLRAFSRNHLEGKD